MEPAKTAVKKVLLVAPTKPVVLKQVISNLLKNAVLVRIVEPAKTAVKKVLLVVPTKPVALNPLRQKTTNAARTKAAQRVRIAARMAKQLVPIKLVVPSNTPHLRNTSNPWFAMPKGMANHLLVHRYETDPFFEFVYPGCFFCTGSVATRALTSYWSYL